MKTSYVINRIDEVRHFASVVKAELCLTEHICDAVKDKTMGIDSSVDLSKDDLRKLNEAVFKACVSLSMAMSRLKAADLECDVLLNSLAEGVEDYRADLEEDEDEDEEEDEEEE